MSTEDRILRLENAMSALAEMAADQQRRVSRLDESLVAIIELNRSHNESMDELRSGQVELRSGQAELRAAQIESEQKIGALVDAHIRTEDALARLAETVNDILRNGRNGQSPS